MQIFRKVRVNAVFWGVFRDFASKRASKALTKSCDVGLRCKESACFTISSDAKSLRFGLSLQFGLWCKCRRCQIACDVGQAMRTTKLVSKGKHTKNKEFLAKQEDKEIQKEKIMQRRSGLRGSRTPKLWKATRIQPLSRA